MHAVFALRKVGGAADSHADRLRLVGREHHPARGEADHGERLLLGRARRLDVDEPPVGRHPPQHQRDAVGGGLCADIVEDDLGRAGAVLENEPCRRHQQVGCGPCRRLRGGQHSCHGHSGRECAAAEIDRVHLVSSWLFPRA